MHRRVSEDISSIKKILSNERIFLKFLEIILALLKSLDHIVEIRGKYGLAIGTDSP
jgi:heme oxygenase